MKLQTHCFLIALIFTVFSCTSTSRTETAAKQEPEALPEVQPPSSVSCVFCGDVMAHTQNFRMSDFNLIWEDVKEITSAADFTFANIEAPVNDDMPFENYPTFNMKYSYPQAAIDAGINVITVANNHTNDHLDKGIRETRKWETYITEKYAASERPVYVSGLKQDISSIENAEKSEVSFCTFSKNGISFLFLGVTQILNSQHSKSLINYFPNTEEQNKKLAETVRTLRETHPCDVFVLALHSDEPEYILSVTDARKKLYAELLDAGVDILWANHPHVVKPVEYIADSRTQKIKKAVFYANGNTISGQRWKPDFKNPAASREYTGDGIFVSLEVKKENGVISIENPETIYITTFIDSSKNYLIKQMNSSFYDFLGEQGLTLWKNYLIEREKLLKQQKEILTWQ